MESDGTQSAHVQNQGCTDEVSTARDASHTGFAGSLLIGASLLSEPVYCRLIVHNLTFGYVTQMWLRSWFKKLYGDTQQ